MGRSVIARVVDTVRPTVSHQPPGSLRSVLAAPAPRPGLTCSSAPQAPPAEAWFVTRTRGPRGGVGKRLFLKKKFCGKLFFVRGVEVVMASRSPRDHRWRLWMGMLAIVWVCVRASGGMLRRAFPSESLSCACACTRRALLQTSPSLWSDVAACLPACMRAESLVDYANEAIAQLESQKRQAAARGHPLSRVHAHVPGAACATHIDTAVTNLTCGALQPNSRTQPACVI